MKVPHPIPYQGSKRRLAPTIVSCFPTKVGTLYEPFAGSGAVSLAAAAWGKACRFCLNDTNAPLITLWEAIIERPNSITGQYRKLWDEQEGREREYYDLVRDRFNRTHRPADFLYLLARCVKASVRYNANGEFNQSPDNRRKGAHPDTMGGHIVGASRLLAGRTILTAVDFEESLRSATSADLVYMDPPYQGVCRGRDPRYIAGLGFDRFVDTLRSLNDRWVPYIVSYDGRTGSTSYGRRLPVELRLRHLEIHAGRSTQGTLLGRSLDTYESLYLSPSLAEKAPTLHRATERTVSAQMVLL